MAGIDDLTKKWEGYKETFTNTSGSITAIYTCDWDKRVGARSDLLATYNSDYTYLVCNQVDIEALGDAASGGGPETAKLTVTFVDQVIGAIEHVQNVPSDWMESWAGGGEAITIGEGFHWYGTTKKIKGEDISAVKIFPTASISITGVTDKITTAAKGKILGCIGKINSVAFSIKNKTYPVGELLFLSGDLQEGLDSLGNSIHTLTYNWAYRSDITWNEFWNPTKSPAGFQAISDSNNDGVYESISFSNLVPSNW